MLFLDHFLHLLSLLKLGVDLLLHLYCHLCLIKVLLAFFEHLVDSDLTGSHIFDFNLPGDQFGPSLVLVTFLKEFVEDPSRLVPL